MRLTRDSLGKRYYENIIPLWTIEASEYLWEHRKVLNKDGEDGWVFDYPGYGGLPKRCANKLSSGTVDWIQESAPFDGMTKREFQKQFIGLCLFEY